MRIEQNTAFSELLEIAGVDGARYAVAEMENLGPRLLQEIQDGMRAADGHAVAEAAHSLKSSCGALSLNRSADLADTLEEKARSGGDAEDLSDLAAALQETFREELETVRSYLDRQT